MCLSFEMFPVTKWATHEITEDHVFETLEFLYDHVAQPGELVDMASDTGYRYTDYDEYDQKAGREEFRRNANAFLADYKSGFELTKEGHVLALASDGLQHILNAEILPYDEVNVDSKVRRAIIKWRNRHLSPEEKKSRNSRPCGRFRVAQKEEGTRKNPGSQGRLCYL
jgi:hypothetical protein